MTPKELAIQHIQKELDKQGKTFLAFHNELNPAIRKLVHSQIKEQVSITNPANMPVRHKKELVARCFFCKGNVKYENYQKYYKKITDK